MTKSELEKEIKVLKEKVNELEKKLKSTSEFEVGDTYYCMAENGNVLNSVWDNDGYDLARQQIGNCFKTREEAEFMVERLKVIKELEDYAKEHNDEIDWYDSDNLKYSICYNYYNKCVDITTNWYMRANDIYFSSKEIATNAIKEIGRERIKKYYSKVEE